VKEKRESFIQSEDSLEQEEEEEEEEEEENFEDFVFII
jgi:hypothetical protein